jgi:hypothetical protein
MSLIFSFPKSRSQTARLEKSNPTAVPLTMVGWI